MLTDGLLCPTAGPARRVAIDRAAASFAQDRPATIPICNEELPHCNDRCLHCGVAHIMQRAKAMPLGDVKRHIAAIAADGERRIMFAVSELTIRTDFLAIVRACQRLRFETVAVVTNGRRFAYESFAEATVAAGATHFLVSVYGADRRVHEGITRTPGSFEQTRAGIERLLQLDCVVMTNTVVTKRNADSLEQIVETLCSWGVRRICLSFVQIIGAAADHARSLVPRMRDVVPSLRRAVEAARGRGATVGIGGVPYCLLADEPALFGVDDLSYVHSGRPGDQITERSPYAYASPCERCAARAVCLGVQEEYLNRFGAAELRPIAGPIWTQRPMSELGYAVFPELFHPPATPQDRDPRSLTPPHAMTYTAGRPHEG